MTISQMRDRKIELGLSNEKLSELSGVPLGTVQKVMGGSTTRPRQETVEALERVLGPVAPDDTDRPPKFSAGRPGPEAASGAPPLREAVPRYDSAEKEVRHTVEEYYALPDDMRVELIDGVFYDLAAPSVAHQRIIRDLTILFDACIAAHGMPCEVLPAPFDVRLDQDEYTMVQPDILVCCDESHLMEKRYEGAPALVVEVLSPSNRMKELFLKLYKYQNAGVREYWIVDPVKRTVTVHYFEAGDDYEPRKYLFEEKIPVGISGGKCRINFSKIRA